MACSYPKLMIVEPNASIMEELIRALSYRFDAQLTCVPDGNLCLETDMVEPHDLVIAELELPDMSGLELASQLLSLRTRPLILVGESPMVDDAIEALRLGVKDMFRHPLDVDGLLDAVDRGLRGYELHRNHSARYRKMRELVRRAIRERRQLNHRVDLVCRDLVSAHRRLVQRVMTSETQRTASK